MNKIALIVPYYGEYPITIQSWLDTVSINPEVDFIIFSDKPPKYKLPQNLIWHNISFNEVKKLAQKCFEFPIWLETPYKLCDYKPAFGLIFKEYLTKYEFWGHCDPDIVWGRFSDFITDDILNNNDRIYTRGHLCIYRNTEKINLLFKYNHNFRDCYRYDRVYTRMFGCDYDEWGTKYGLGLSTICNRLLIPTYDKIDFADISFSHFDFRLAIKDGFEPQVFVSTPQGLFGYRLVNNMLQKKEYLYVHLQKRNMRVNEYPGFGKCFIIKPNEFLPFNSENELIDIISNIPQHKFYGEWYKKRIKRFFSKLREGALCELIYRKLCIKGFIEYKG